MKWQSTIEELKHKLANVSLNSVDDLRKTKEDDDSQKVHALEKQVDFLFAIQPYVL